MADEEKTEQKAQEEPAPADGKVLTSRGKVSTQQIAEIEMGKFYTIPQLAQIFHFSRGWITKLVQEGRIKGVKILGSQWRIPQSEYEKIIKEGIKALPREPRETPPVTTVKVDEKLSKRIMPPRKEAEEKSKPLFPLDFSGLFSKGK